MSPPTRTATGIPRWPTISVVLNTDGTGRLTIDGRDERFTAGDIDAARSIVLERVIATAATVGRPVRLHSTDPDGQWELAIHPDGRVDELAAHPAPPAAAAAPDTHAVVPPVRARQPIARSTPSARRGSRVAVRAAAALALLTGLASAATLVLTNGPATVVRGSTPITPITPINAASTPDEASRAAAVASGQRATQRRQAAEQKRRQREALQRRVAARQARERRAVRRRAAARRAARRAARNARRAAARRRSSPPASRPARANPPARRPAPAPRAAPEFTAPQSACGEFDLC